MPSKLSGKIQTVTGTISPKQLGIRLTHEHLFIDLARLFNPDIDDSNYEFFHSKLDTEVLVLSGITIRPIMTITNYLINRLL